MSTDAQQIRRFAVTGGRDYQDAHAVIVALTQVPETATLVHGAATGADSLAAGVWADRDRPVEAHPADWQLFGKGAGPRRNQEMVDSGLDLLIAFPGGRGTADMVRRCEAAGVPILTVGGES